MRPVRFPWGDLSAVRARGSRCSSDFLITDRGVLAFMSTVTVFGTPVDITLSEIALECFYPANAETAQALRDVAA